MHEEFVFNGIIYRRFPNARQYSDRIYFRCDKHDHKKGFGYLHRDVWKFHNGEIPPKHHIHHKDENTENNDISNLQCISASDHSRWHGKENWKNQNSIKKTCEYCKKEFETKQYTKRFCSKNCWSLSRYYSGVDNEIRKCTSCGKDFETNKNQSHEYCSSKCSAKNAFSRRKEVILKCVECTALFKSKVPQKKYCAMKCKIKANKKSNNN